MGDRLKGRGLLYPVNETALKYGAGVEQETSDAKEAHARFAELVPVPCPDDFSLVTHEEPDSRAPVRRRGLVRGLA